MTEESLSAEPSTVKKRKAAVLQRADMIAEALREATEYGIEGGARENAGAGVSEQSEMELWYGRLGSTAEKCYTGSSKSPGNARRDCVPRVTGEQEDD